MPNPLDRLDDSLRTLQDRAPARPMRWALLALLTLLTFGLLLLRGFAGAVDTPAYTAPVLAALFALLCALSLVFLFRLLGQHRAGTMLYVLLGLALVGVLMMRSAVLEYRQGDYEAYLGPWAELMRGFSFSDALSRNITDYNVPYQYLIFGISRVPLPDLYLYKWVSMLADVLLAFLLLRILQRYGKAGLLGQCFCYFLTLCWPTFVLNSALWAQCDVIYAGLALGGVYLALTDRPYLGAGAFALALGFKLQAVFLLPAGLILWGMGKLRLKHILFAVLFYFVPMIPAVLAGMPPERIFTVYMTQAQQYKGLVMGAPSMYQLLQATGSQSPMFFFLGLSLAAVSVLVLCGFLLQKRDRLTPVLVLDACLLMAMLLPFLLPRMHERYLYLAECCALVYVALHPKRFPVAVLLLLCSLNGYLEFFQEFTFMPQRIGAGLVLLLLLFLCMLFRRDILSAPLQNALTTQNKEGSP